VWFTDLSDFDGFAPNIFCRLEQERIRLEQERKREMERIQREKEEMRRLQEMSR